MDDALPGLQPEQTAWPATELFAGVRPCLVLEHMMLKDTVVQNLFDATGRRIPGPGVTGRVNAACTRYGLVQPTIDYAAIHARTLEYMGGDGQVPAGVFAEEAERILDTLRRNEETAPIANGVRVPFLLGPDRRQDLGQALEDLYLPAIGRSWKARFPKADFKNELKGGLAGKVAVAAGSRYERLLQALAEGPVVGYYFPLALSGFSVTAALESIADLPDTFLLSGGYEASAALTGSPDLIVQDGYPPQLDLSAFHAPAAGYGYHFAPYGYNLTFNGRFHNGLASDYCSSGLTVIAPRKQK